MIRKQVNLPIEAIVNFLRALDPQTREEIFQEVFIDCDTEPLSVEEEHDLNVAMNEYEKGETVSWPISE